MYRDPQDPREDSDIIRKFQTRDESGIRDAENRYGRFCLDVALSVLDNRQDAEECVNDTWLKAWNSIPPEDPPSFKNYLGRLTRHTAIDRWRTRHRKKRGENMTDLLAELDEVAPAEEDTSALAADLTNFLRTLETVERNLFVGRYWYAYPTAVLAAEQGLSVNAVVLRLSRTRTKLRAYLTERGYTL